MWQWCASQLSASWMEARSLSHLLFHGSLHFFAICSGGCYLGLSLAWCPSSVAPWIISSLDAFPFLPLHVATIGQREGMEVPNLSLSWRQVKIILGVLFLGISPERGEEVALGAELSPTILLSWPHSSVLGSGTKNLLHPLRRNKNPTD